MPDLDYATYHDKVLGGWAGKCAGGVVGAPLEGFKRFHDLELKDEMFETAVPNDDLDLQILWLDLVKRRGPSLRLNDLADHWKAHVDFPWNEYGMALRNLRLGVYPPQSGSHNNWYWRKGMGSPIRSEIWGMLCPGLPAQAAFYATMDSSLDHEGFSVRRRGLPGRLRGAGLRGVGRPDHHAARPRAVRAGHAAPHPGDLGPRLERALRRERVPGEDQERVRGRGLHLRPDERGASPSWRC